MEEKREESFEEFKRRLQKHRGAGKVRGTCPTNRDMYRWICKNRVFNLTMSVLTEGQWSKIIQEVHNAIIERLIEGHTIVLPYRMGRLDLERWDRRVKINRGKASTNLPVNWLATLKLWYEDRDAMEKKIRIRQEFGSMFCIGYNKRRARYNNMVFYRLMAYRSLRKVLNEMGRDGKIDGVVLRGKRDL